MTAIPVTVTTPSGYTFTVSSIRAAARMLDGYGKASGGLRKTISEKALLGLTNPRSRGKHNIVRNNALVG